MSIRRLVGMSQARSHLDGSSICLYCGRSNLEGDEGPEHILPAAINARLTTHLVCAACNTRAGKEIDQPWLKDPFVLSARTQFEIPDRRGNRTTKDELLKGETAEGQRIEVDREGRPIATNSVVSRSEDGTRVLIKAPDMKEAQKLVARVRAKLLAEGNEIAFESGFQGFSEQVAIEVEHCLDIRSWQSMAAKVALGFIGRGSGADWRSTDSACLLRALARGEGDRTKITTPKSPEVFAQFALVPSSALVVFRHGAHTNVAVSLMGIFAFMIQLNDPIAVKAQAWVSDPLNPSRSIVGGLGEVIGARDSSPNDRQSGCQLRESQ